MFSDPGQVEARESAREGIRPGQRRGEAAVERAGHRRPHEGGRGAGRDHGVRPVTGELARERRGSVLVARLNRPEARNALNGALIRGISAAIVDAEADPEIRAVVITGTGDRAFCAGMDLREFAGGGQAGGDPGSMEGFLRLIEGEVSLPVIGAADATAAAGGVA